MGEGERQSEEKEPPTPIVEAGPGDEGARARRRRVVAVLWRWTKRALLAGTILVALAALALVLLVRHFESDLPSIADLKGNYHPPQVTRVLARDGTLLAEIFTERRTVVPISTLPPHVKLAVLAAEDAGFYEHQGVNYVGIARALIVNLRAGRTKQGGSTITQQVVKNLLLDPEKTYKRKIREALLARRLEQELTKDEILELYLNHIYFGHGRYGIEEAARDDFGKSAKDLTIGEAAMLAGLVASPDHYSPRHDMKLALARRGYVLGQMHEKGFLNDAQYEAASVEPVVLAPAVEPSNELAPEAVEIARRTLKELEPEEAKLGGFTVTTTIDPRLQLAARKALRDGLAAYDKRHALTAGLKAPPAPSPVAEKRGKPRGPPRDSLPPFEGTPSFDQHKVLVGVVTDTDDTQGTIDVRVGTVLGTIHLSDYDRYNPAGLSPSAYAAPGAHVRVSLLAPVPSGQDEGSSGSPPGAEFKVPLRLESGPEGALVALDVRTRQVLALVGSYEGQMGALDRATQARRQPGSTFKPIVYSYAIHSRRFTTATLVDPNPDLFEGGYKPTNYEGWQGKDPVRLREALANSINIVAVRVLRDVGPISVVSWAEALGIKSPMKPDLSLALGSYELQPIELAGAYATFAAGGVYEEPEIITRIVGPDGKDVPLKARLAERRVLDEADAYLTTSMLTSVIEHGTGAKARALGRPLAGKTGTSNQSKDAWFAGYSTDLATVVWVGYDDSKPLGGAEMGATTALPAWMAFMKVALEGRPKSDFPRPAGISTVAIDRRTGMLPYPDDPDAMDEVFLTGTEPSEVATPPPPDAGPPDNGPDGGTVPAAEGGIEARVSP